MTTNKEWIEICETYCKTINATLVFVNDADFGYEKNGNFVHLYADELAARLTPEMLKGE